MGTLTFLSSRFPWLKLGRKEKEGCITIFLPAKDLTRVTVCPAWVTYAVSARLLIKYLFSKLPKFGYGHPIYESHQVSLKLCQ